MNYFLIKKIGTEKHYDLRSKLNKHIHKELVKLSSKLNNLKGRIDRGSKEEEYGKIANLLLINIHSIKKGMNKIELEDLYEPGKPVKVNLNPKLSPKKNVDAYFDKAKSERIGLVKSRELYEKLQNEFTQLKEFEKRVEKTEEPEELRKLMKELKMPTTGTTHKSDDMKDKFKHYIIEGKYNVFVGKDSKNNDLLTMKFAKQNDYWFHARSVPGSHVVLRIDNSKESVPKPILKTAASLAAFHSKAKTAGVVPVSYTFKKYVVKKKGMEPGKVALLKEDVLLVKPEVPDNCEYIFSE